MNFRKAFFSTSTFLRISLQIAAFIASLSTIVLPLIIGSTLTACGNDNTAGTDEQANSVTAKIDAAIDSASAIWFQGEKTFIVDSKANISTPGNTPLHDFVIYPDTSTQHTSLQAGIKSEHGLLRQLDIDYFSSLSCQTEETWFAYMVKVSSSLIQKTFTIPDTTATSIAKDFETDCILENGTFITETEGVTEGQRSFSCKFVPTKENLVEKNAIQYTDPTWEKYGKQIIKVCREG